MRNVLELARGEISIMRDLLSEGSSLSSREAITALGSCG